MTLPGSSLSAPEVGIIVSDICVTGKERGSYKVYIPKRHGNISEKADYVALGVNLGGLDATELVLANIVGEACYPLFPLESGGAMPIDPESGVVSSDENSTDVSVDKAATLQGGKIVKGPSEYLESSGTNTKLSHTYGTSSCTQIYVMDTCSGYSPNPRESAPRGNIGKLSVNTRVIVQGNFIMGMLPETQNDWINQFSPLDQTF